MRGVKLLILVFIINLFLWVPSMGLARSVPVIESVTTHFADLPRIILPCGNLKLTYYPEYDRYKTLFDLEKIRTIIQEHEKLIEESLNRSIELQKSLEEVLMAGYAYYRAKGTAGLDEKKAELRFLYAHFSWFWQLDKVESHDAKILEVEKQYFDLTAPLFSALTNEHKIKLIDSLYERLACIHENRQETFDKISRPSRYTFKELAEELKGENFSIEKAAASSSDLARYFGFSREYSWMVSQQTLITSILRTVLQRYEQSLYSNGLYPRMMAAHEKYGAALGPGDKFLPDPEAQKVRLQIARTRARVALNYLYLMQAQSEETFKAQLNFSSGIGPGLKTLGNSVVKSAKDMIRNNDLIRYETFEQDNAIAQLAIVITAADFASSTFTLATSSLTDTVIGIMPSDLGVKKSSEKAFDAYTNQKNDINLSIKVIEKLIDTLNPDDPASFRSGQALCKFIITGNKAGSDIAAQAPNAIYGLLENNGFIDATGGGLGWILEPLCESQQQLTSLLMNAARYSLTGNAKNAFNRIAIDRGLWVDNPDLPLTKETLKGNTLADYADPKGDILWQATIRYGGNLVYFIPVLGQAKLAYDKIPEVRSVLKYEGKNEESQDRFLLDLIDQQEKFDRLLTDLERNYYNFSRLAVKEPESYQIHMSLLSDCPDYLAAYIKVRNVYWERSKMFSSARSTNNGTEKMSPRGKAELAAVSKANELEILDLSTRMSRLKTEFHALSIDYLATAQQLGLLEQLENSRRAAFGIKDKVDLSKSIQAFKREARLSELTLITQNLFKEMMIDLVTANIMNSVSNLIISKFPVKWGVKPIPLQQRILHEELFQSFNPWSKLYADNGVWDVFENAALDTVAISAAQMTGTQLGLGEDFEGSLTKFFSYATNVAKDVSGAVRSATIESRMLKEDVQQRLNLVTEFEPEVKTRIEKDNELALRLFEAIERKDDSRVKELQTEALKRAKDAAVSKDRLRYHEIMDRLRDLSDEETELNTSVKNSSMALEMGEAVKADYLNRISTGEKNEGKIKTAAKIVSLVELQQQMVSGTPDIESLRQLADSNDAEEIRKHLLTENFDIQLLRKGLAAARDRVIERKKKAVDEKAEASFKEDIDEIKAIATRLDDYRIEFINTTLKEFFEIYPEYAEQVQVVMQGGAARGNPEYQGIFGDIDFTILTKPGADSLAIKDKLHRYFKDKGHPLATRETKGYSPMDTESFIQPMGNFKSADESLTNIIKDLVVKMDDPTRFYSEGGGKWFINNMLYSGKKLWGDESALGEWVKITRGEANGLAIDMARYLSFLTDPHYYSKNITAISDPGKKRKTLETVLSKSKYFIRLIDAYVISHDQGNELYHKRIKNKNKSDDDASYHWQIFKDVKGMIDGEHETLFSRPGDLEIIEAMARMKMKGNITSVWDVLGDGPEGIKRAEAMVARMEELAPDILAYTAEVNMKETIDIATRGTEAERRAAFAGQLREASTYKKISESLEFGSKPLMIPKVRWIEKEGKKQLVMPDRKEHRQLIADWIAAYRSIRDRMQAYEKRVENLTQLQARVDPEGKKTREEIFNLLQEKFGKGISAWDMSEKDLVYIEDDTVSGWNQYNWTMAEMLSRELDNNPGEGAER